ncbi:MAG: FeoC-like transcriptional regulator [Candidatus Nanopelagicales bacterium]
MTADPGTPPGAVSAVLAQFETGATSLSAIAAATGLSTDLVRLAIDRLVARGRLTREQLDTGCPAEACGGCRPWGRMGRRAAARTLAGRC